MLCFFFSSRRRHTRWTGDWSSDVCSSDLESYTLYASRAQLLVGPYSRYGWHHPGPLYFYLLAPVYTLAGKSTPGLSAGALRSEERRVGKECRSRLSPYQ